MQTVFCNEGFSPIFNSRLSAPMKFGKVCRRLAQLGYNGVEVAPRTLAPLVTDLNGEARRKLRQIAESAKIEISGLHWLLAMTKGLHLTSSDTAVQQATIDYLVDLAKLCHDLGGKYMVFGSPKERTYPADMTGVAAMSNAVTVFGKVMERINELGVVLTIEPLAHEETNFCTTLANGRSLVHLVNHPNFGLHLDVKAMYRMGPKAPKDVDPADVCRWIEEFGGEALTFHANDWNLRGPGDGTVDFVEILRSLRKSGYQGALSVEVFDFKQGIDNIAANSIKHLRQCEADI